MANCEICGKSTGFMGGGKEPYTGKELYICNECGMLFKKLTMLGKEGSVEQFRTIKGQLLGLAEKDDLKKAIEDFSGSLEHKAIDKMRENEKRQQREENKRVVLENYEEMSASFLSTTGYNFEGYMIEEYLGIVNGQTVLGTGFASEFAASVSDAFGTASKTFSSKIRSAKELAFEDMQKEALYKGANAMIGIDIDIMTMANNMIAVSANATAVKIKKV